MLFTARLSSRSVRPFVAEFSQNAFGIDVRTGAVANTTRLHARDALGRA